MALIKRLKDSVWEVRHAAIKGLGALAEPAATEALCGMLQDEDRDVRESAAAALGRIADSCAIPHLVQMLIDPESSVRNAAANSLKGCDPHWEKRPEARQVVPKLKEALEHKEYWVRHSAGKVLERLNVNVDGPEASDSTEEETNGLAQTIFVILGDLIHDRDRDLRLAAATALEHLQAKTARPLLVTATDDSDPYVQQIVQRALAKLN
jgi:HEAT repeat protein